MTPDGRDSEPDHTSLRYGNDSGAANGTALTAEHTAANEMSQASAQREPSMEEILASIRRIIEDSDGGERPGASSGALDSVELDPDNADMDAFLDELSDRATKPALAPANQSARPDNQKPEPASPLVSALATAPVVSPAQKTVPQPSPAQAVAAGPAQPVEERAGPAAPSVELPITAEPESAKPQPIVSVQTGRQVQAAFGELNDVFQKARTKSFDHVAEEMVRPMLQEWLDNNLPTLVERLVREEIERVSRGE